MAKLSANRSDIDRFHRYVPARDDPGFAAENIDLLLGTDDDAPEKIFEEDIMAKLSAHGRIRDRPTPPLRFAGEEDVYFSLRTDGYVLEKRALHWRDGDSNRGNWKLHSKIKAATAVERRKRIPVIFPKFIRNLIGQGFTLREGPAFFEVRDQLREDA
ncbi:MAG: hypothetical protein GY835_19365 [bacterium]|nr:hypothetical protein [bacterium]